MEIDPQKAPPPEFTRAPKRWEELFLATARLFLVVFRVLIKIVAVAVAFIVAFIGAMSWRR